MMLGPVDHNSLGISDHSSHVPFVVPACRSLTAELLRGKLLGKFLCRTEGRNGSFISDLDHTLLNQSAVYKALDSAVAAHFGIDNARLLQEVDAGNRGKPASDYLEAFRQACSRAIGRDIPDSEFHAVRALAILDLTRSEAGSRLAVREMPAAADLLNGLYGLGRPIRIATSSPRLLAELALEKTSFGQLFPPTALFSEYEFPEGANKSTTIFWYHVLRNVSPRASVGFEDTVSGAKNMVEVAGLGKVVVMLSQPTIENRERLSELSAKHPGRIVEISDYRQLFAR